MVLELASSYDFVTQIGGGNAIPGYPLSRAYPAPATLKGLFDWLWKTVLDEVYEFGEGSEF